MTEGITIKAENGAIIARIHYMHPDGRYRSTHRELKTDRRITNDDVSKWLMELQAEMETLKNPTPPNKDFLRLKWGSFKACDFTNSPEAYETLQEYLQLCNGGGAAQQENAPRERELLCKMIDQVNGSVTIYWTGEDCTNDREKAKRYVMTYGTEAGRAEFG